MPTPNILMRIVESKQARLARAAQGVNVDELRERAIGARAGAEPHLLRRAIQHANRINVIAEMKRASPSKGVIRADAVPAEIARQYQKGGAVAISVLTDEEFFHGSMDDLREVRAAVSLPVLRKDFILGPLEVYESAVAGADAILLIASILDDTTLARLLRITEEDLGLDALVEVRGVKQMLRAHALGANLVGINNRDLQTFEVTIEESVEVARCAPDDILLVSESGLNSAKQLQGLRALGFKGFLIGESLMRAEHPGEALSRLISEAMAGSHL